VAGEPEVVEFGGPEPARRPWVLPTIVALVVGLAFGFLLGREHPAAVTAPVAQASPSPVEPNPIVGTGRSCSITRPGPGGKDDLELGTEIQNRSKRPLTLETPGVGLPLHGLRIAQPPTLTACGELPGIIETVLIGGASTWVSVRVHVPGGACPAAEPVLFVINYLDDGDRQTANVGGFNDLGKVPYPSCT
jgi:hypothetical protein